jgi:hypothetical protein
MAWRLRLVVAERIERIGAMQKALNRRVGDNLVWRGEQQQRAA